jgi:SAM-dependent methyltransferase
MTRLLLAVFFSIIACTARAQQTTQHANDQKSQQSFEEMVKSLERPDRWSWQKPEEVMNLIRPLKSKKVMDLGSGYFTFKMIDSGATVIAADIDERFLKYVDSVRNARGISKKQVQIRKVPADNPLLEKREVDLVLIVNTYHHLEDRVDYLRKIKAGLRQFGYVAIVDFFKKDLPVGPPTNEKLSADDVIRELKMAGFSQFRTEEKTLPYQYIVFAL